MTGEKLGGLISQAVARALRWVSKKLTATYVTLHLADIGKAIKIGSQDDVRELLLTMVRSLPSSFILSPTYITLWWIESNDISAQIRDCDVLGPATAVHERTS